MVCGCLAQSQCSCQSDVIDWSQPVRSDLRASGLKCSFKHPDRIGPEERPNQPQPQFRRSFIKSADWWYNCAKQQLICHFPLEMGVSPWASGLNLASYVIASVKKKVSWKQSRGGPSLEKQTPAPPKPVCQLRGVYALSWNDSHCPLPCTCSRTREHIALLAREDFDKSKS